MRLTDSVVKTRVENLNTRMEEYGSIYRYTVHRRNGMMALDRQKDGVNYNHVVSGTRTFIADYINAMMCALDDAKIRAI